MKYASKQIMITRTFSLPGCFRDQAKPTSRHFVLTHFKLFELCPRVFDSEHLGHDLLLPFVQLMRALEFDIGCFFGMAIAHLEWGDNRVPLLRNVRKAKSDCDFVVQVLYPSTFNELARSPMCNDFWETFDRQSPRSCVEEELEWLRSRLQLNPDISKSES